MIRKLYTLVFVRREASILLGFKKRGFGKGKWNGFGGKVELGESIEEAAVRELLEECSLKVGKEDLNKIGILSFVFVEMPDQLMEVHVFSTSDFSGEPEESEEMRPKWFGLDSIPFADMWADDKYWFPIFLNGKKFIGDYIFEEQEKILSQNLVEVNAFP